MEAKNKRRREEKGIVDEEETSGIEIGGGSDEEGNAGENGVESEEGE